MRLKHKYLDYLTSEHCESQEREHNDEKDSEGSTKGPNDGRETGDERLPHPQHRKGQRRD